MQLKRLINGLTGLQQNIAHGDGYFDLQV